MHISGGREESSRDDDGEEMHRNMHLHVERIVLSEKRRRKRKKERKKGEKRSERIVDVSSRLVERRSTDTGGGCSFVVLESCLESKHVRVLRRMDENRYLDHLPSKEKNFFQQDKICVLHIYKKRKGKERKKKNLSLERMAFSLLTFSF